MSQGRLGLFLPHHQCDVPFRTHYVLQGCHLPLVFLLCDVSFRMHHVLQGCHLPRSDGPDLSMQTLDRQLVTSSQGSTIAPCLETLSLDTCIPTCSRHDAHFSSIESPRGISKDPQMHSPHYFMTSSFWGLGVTKPLFSRSDQRQADYLIDITVGIAPGHPQIYDPD